MKSAITFLWPIGLYIVLSLTVEWITRSADPQMPEPGRWIPVSHDKSAVSAPSICIKQRGLDGVWTKPVCARGRVK